MKSKFYKPPTLKERLTSLKYCFLFWKGRKKGMIHTMNIGWRQIRPIFFPKDFYETYSYLGSVPYNEEGDYFKAIYPLVLAMDYEAKPKFCPRWFLRFLDVFGNDSSIVRVRNRRLSDLFTKLTKAVEWLEKVYNKNGYILQDTFDKAKEMEKEQIIDAFVECWKENMPDGYECKQSAEYYYNLTYGGNK